MARPKKQKETRHEWSPTDKFEITGLELQALNDLITVLTSDDSSSYTKSVYTYEVSKIFPPMFDRFIKEGKIKEITE